MTAPVYQSHKKVSATPLTRKAYNDLRGWDLPKDENGDDEGYLVQLLDGSKPNMEGYDNYLSWSPKDQFDNGYTLVPEKVLVQEEALAREETLGDKLASVKIQIKVDPSHINDLIESLTFKFRRRGDSTTTICSALLPNGFSIGFGSSACVIPSEYSSVLGEKYAKERALTDAINNLWEKEGYLLMVTGKTSEAF